LEFLGMIPTKPGNQGDTQTNLLGSRRTGRVAKPSTTTSEDMTELSDYQRAVTGVLVTGVRIEGGDKRIRRSPGDRRSRRFLHTITHRFPHSVYASSAWVCQ
jgi:hypothetical protein